MIRDQERAAVMVARHLSGETMTQIANDYGISRERVRQVVRAVGCTPDQTKESKWVTVNCGQCGAPKRLKRGFVSYYQRNGRENFFCNKVCAGIARRKGPEQGYSIQMGADGHWWTRDQYCPPGKNRMCRLERYIMQEMMGRPLHRNEWVHLKDGDPNNVSPENLEVHTPKQAMELRYRNQDYYAAGNGPEDNCGHRHWTLDGATMCAKYKCNRKYKHVYRFWKNRRGSISNRREHTVTWAR
jgi:hypothetical protein